MTPFFPGIVRLPGATRKAGRAAGSAVSLAAEKTLP